MADEQYRWLNRDAAERLLRGEPLEAVDADTRAHADRLAEVLGALTAEVPPVSPLSAELPGEEAALAAFRSARTARSAENAENAEATEPGRGPRTHTATAPAADAGLVRLGRPGRSGADGRRARWARPVRFGLVAALAAGMLGGVAVAAGSGALSAFRDDEPEPSATLSAGQSPDRPLLSPSPSAEAGDGERGILGGPTPEDSPDASSKGDAPSGEGTGGTGEDGQPGDTGQDEGSTQEWWNSVFSACRDVRDGKELDADRRRGLEDAAGGKGKGHLKQYCAGVLAGGDNPGTAKRPGTGTGTGSGTGTSDSGDSTGPAGGDGDNTRSGNDFGDEDDDSDSGKGRGGGGNGKGDGNGRWNGNGKGKGDKNKGGKGNGGNSHRGQVEAVTPVGAVAVGPDASPVPLSPLSRAL
ncbi:hypothetical protein JIX56_16325 [Streptomyces sp. CA-210063]|uniref:hypothetical protein n=1 Tax=Streptomyces sp. CA-210063 TaxID=2801029 RepID=UPI00214C4684|nr:hypothetical protein [Streptomyces sp. CA-210063]UUU31343.1 hypothetical protein JIX56_16325 [Streptomyces sp. CA-210063]